MHLSFHQISKTTIYTKILLPHYDNEYCVYTKFLTLNIQQIDHVQNGMASFHIHQQIYFSTCKLEPVSN